VFDRLFGTFASDVSGVRCRFGLSEPLLSHNPVRIALHEWSRLARDAWRAGSLRGAARVLLGPPG